MTEASGSTDISVTAHQSLLHDRRFRRLFGAHAISFLGDGMVNVATAFAVISRGGSASDIGIVFAARMLALVLCILVGGVLADRVPRRMIMATADLVRVCSQGGFAALILTGSGTVGELAALAGVTGAATGFFNPASTGLLPSVVAGERIQQANALRGLALAAGQVVGPAVAGGLIAAFGAGSALAFDAATFGASALLLLSLDIPAAADFSHESFSRDLRDGWRAFRARTWVWSFVGGAAVGNFVFAAWGVLGPVVAHSRMGGAATWGAIVSAFGGGSVLGGIVALRLRPARPMLVASASVSVFSLPLALLALGSGPLLVGAGAFLSGVGLMVANTLWESTLQRHIPQAALSRVSAYDWFGSMAFEPLGFAMWGVVASAIGIGVSLWIAFTVQIMSVAALLMVPDIRHLPAYPDAHRPSRTASPADTAG